MRQVATLRITNEIIYVLALFGSIFLAFSARQCIEDCEYSYASYQTNPLVVAAGIAGILFSTLTFQVINLFALHIENSHDWEKIDAKIAQQEMEARLKMQIQQDADLEKPDNRASNDSMKDSQSNKIVLVGTLLITVIVGVILLNIFFR